MYEKLIADVMSQLEGLSNLDFAELPSFVFMTGLRDQLVFTGFSVEDAESIVTAIEIEIAPGIITDQQLSEFITIYCKVINKIHDALKAKNFQNPTQVIKKLAGNFSLKIG
jgi:hypothetical protein